MITRIFFRSFVHDLFSRLVGLAEEIPKSFKQWYTSGGTLLFFSSALILVRSSGLYWVVFLLYTHNNWEHKKEFAQDLTWQYVPRSFWVYKQGLLVPWYKPTSTESTTRYSSVSHRTFYISLSNLLQWWWFLWGHNTPDPRAVESPYIYSPTNDESGGCQAACWSHRR